MHYISYMNKKINCLTSSQLDLYRSHIDYILDNNMMEKTPSDLPFANTHQQYGDIITELLLHYLKPKIQKIYGKELVPTYSFWRRYYKNQDCFSHKDRESCQVSVSISLGGKGGDDWAFYVEDKKHVLEPGQGVLYNGIELEHWRHKLPYESHSNIFLHYIEKDGEYYPKYKYDRRPQLYIMTP